VQQTFQRWQEFKGKRRRGKLGIGNLRRGGEAIIYLCPCMHLSSRPMMSDTALIHFNWAIILILKIEYAERRYLSNREGSINPKIKNSNRLGLG